MTIGVTVLFSSLYQRGAILLLGNLTPCHPFTSRWASPPAQSEWVENGDNGIVELEGTQKLI